MRGRATDVPRRKIAGYGFPYRSCAHPGAERDVSHHKKRGLLKGLCSICGLLSLVEFQPLNSGSI